jgi:uncharacterized protein (TIGR02145 family)
MWTTLTDYLGGLSLAGGKMKETGVIHWTSPNTGATNSSGFAGLPGGLRNYNGTFASIGSYGYWWSSTVANTAYAWDRMLSYIYSSVGRGSDVKSGGFSVRCIRD